MNYYSERSLAVLDTVHPDLVRVFAHVLPRFNHTPVRGIRDLALQKEYMDIGWSKTLDSRHLPGGGLVPDVAYPDLSWALDARPWPFNDDREQLYMFGGFVLGVALELGIELRFGGDWDGDKDLRDQTFFDLWHFEIRRHH